MSAIERPLPHPTRVSRPFWEACARHELLVQRCTDCGRLTFVPQAFCRHCLSRSLEWTPSGGRGELYSYTVVWRPQTPAFETPYVVGIVRLDDGYDMLTNIVGCDPEKVRVGMRVRADWDDRKPGVTLPVFRPDDDEATTA